MAKKPFKRKPPRTNERNLRKMWVQLPYFDDYVRTILVPRLIGMMKNERGVKTLKDLRLQLNEACGSNMTDHSLGVLIKTAKLDLQTRLALGINSAHPRPSPIRTPGLSARPLRKRAEGPDVLQGRTEQVEDAEDPEGIETFDNVTSTGPILSPSLLAQMAEEDIGRDFEPQIRLPGDIQ